MNRQDELEQLWRSQPLDKQIKGEDMKDLVLKKISAFDRKIRMRNRVETAAAIVVVVFFAYVAWAQRNAIQRLGSLIVVAGAMWIIFYLRRHGANPVDPAPDQTVDGYRRALAQNYDHQIRLLRNVKFWYLLPMYIGLLTTTLGMLLEQAKTRQLNWADALAPLIYTLIFGAVWWLNEVHGVQTLERSRTSIMSGIESLS